MNGGLVTRRLLNATELALWAHGEGFTDLVPNAWHVTLAGGLPAGVALDLTPETLPPSPARTVSRLGEVIVLEITSPMLEARHYKLRAAGAPWAFQRYRPHITFTVDDGRDLGLVQAYAGSLKLGPESTDHGWRTT